MRRLMRIVIVCLIAVTALATIAAAPAMAGVHTTNNADNAWHTADYGFTLQATTWPEPLPPLGIPIPDPVNWTKFRVGSGAWITNSTPDWKHLTWTTPVVILADGSTEGVNTVQYYSDTQFLPPESDYPPPDPGIHSCTVKIDTGPPLTAATGSGGEDLALWHNHAIVVELVASDTWSGVTTLWYKMGGILWTTATGRTASVTASAQGLNTVSFHARDVAGNTEAVKSVTAKVDLGAPTTSVSGGSGVDLTQWHDHAITLTFSGYDPVLLLNPPFSTPLSGVAKTEYQIDGGSWTTGTSVAISAQGDHTVNYRSQDNAGNVEAAKNVHVKINSGNPSAPQIVSLTPNHGLPAASVIVAGSGFGAAQGASSVNFGTTVATVTGWSATSVTCLVPSMAAGATNVAVTVGGLTSNAAAFTVEAARTVPSLTLKLSGLSSGSLKLGRRVTARCTVTPSSLAGGHCRLTVQKKKGTRWARVAALTWTIGPSGSYNWKYKPAMRGSYRMQATVAAAAQHTSGKAPWLAFRVK